VTTSTSTTTTSPETHTVPHDPQQHHTGARGGPSILNDYPAWTLPSTRTECAIKHAEIRPVIQGTDLCGPCHGRFPRILNDIVDGWSTLAGAVVKRPTQQYKERVQTSGVSDGASLWNPAATLVMVDIADWVGFLARTIIREHPLPPAREHSRHGGRGEPSPFALDPDASTPLTLAVIARWHYRWLSHYPGLGESVFRDALLYRDAGVRALNVDAVKPARIKDAYCQREVENSNWGPILCMGQLVAIMTDEGTPAKIICTNHPDHEVPRSEWIHLNAG
jgi:hypothetical protein